MSKNLGSSFFKRMAIMTLTINGYSPINVAKAYNILRSQYIIPSNDIDLFLKSKEMISGIVEFERETFIFDTINFEIKRSLADKTTITITYHKLDADYILKMMEEQNGTN